MEWELCLVWFVIISCCACTSGDFYDPKSSLRSKKAVDKAFRPAAAPDKLVKSSTSNVQYTEQVIFPDVKEKCRVLPRCSRALLQLQADTREADALLDFKDGITNYANGALDDWTSTSRTHVCSWTGVICNDEMHVTSLHLSSLRMNGSLGPSLSELQYLEELHLSQNFLRSRIPPELGKLVRLRILDLQDNRLFGGIPSVLGNLTSLQVLKLGNDMEEVNRMDTRGRYEAFIQSNEWNRLSGPI